MRRMENNPFVDAAELASLYPSHIGTIKARHDRALEVAGAGHAVIFSGAPRRVFLDDYDYPFKANPHFVGWLPLTTHPYCYLVYTPGETPVLIYFQEKDYWHLPPADPAGYWMDHVEVRIVHEHEEIAQHLPESREQCVLIGEIHDDAHAFGIERVNPTSAMHLLHYNRAVKTGYELECMRRASRRAVAGHRAAEATFREGSSEYDIHMAYCHATGHVESELPYGNIIALNEHGAVLHYQHQERQPPRQSRSFLIDAGASVHGYAADITRTHAKGSREFASLVKRFDRLQQELVSEVQPGVPFADLHISAHRKIAELLGETGIATGSVDSLVEGGVTAAFYPHGLGHLLGIQVHDVGGHMADESGVEAEPPDGHPHLRFTRTLDVDHVLTIEPGIYAIDMLLEQLAGTEAYGAINQERLDWLRPFGGIRIEDNVRVTADGCENLTRDAFAAS